MESSSSDALLGGSSKTPGEKARTLQVEERVCGTGSCGFSDEKSRVADAHARSAAAKKLGMAIVLCLIFIAVEVAGGLISNSLAILTDAAHLLSDVAGFAISLFAIWASSWEATPRQSYGFFRLEILGALLSVQLIWLLTGIIVYEAVYRLTHTSELVNGRLMFFVATFGLCVNIIMVFLLGHHGHNHSHDHGHAHGHSHGDIKNITSDHGHVEDHYHDHSHDDTHDHGGDHHGHDHDHNHNASHHVEDHYHDHSHDDTHDHGGDHHGHDHNHNASHHDELSEELRYSLLEVGRRDSVKVDIDLHSGDTTKAENSNVGNINVKGAWLHVLGDLIQSIGVMIGGAIIWVKPEWRVVDLICTLLFSVLVLGTTIKILRDIMEILMESTPREIDVKKLEKGLCEIPGVIAIHELHIWAITMGKTLLACHVTVYSDADTDDILQRVLGYCDRVFNISHVTVQIERHRENPPC